jgi:hypothetical protein
MGVKEWEASEWAVVPVTTKEEVWRALEIRDESLPLVEKRERNFSGMGTTSEQESSNQDISRVQTYVPESTSTDGDQEGGWDQPSTGTYVTVQEDPSEERLAETREKVKSSTVTVPVEQGNFEPHSEPKRPEIEMHDKPDQPIDSKSN